MIAINTARKVCCATVHERPLRPSAFRRRSMPFPLGLARVAASDARLVPWAWAINGCASVTGAVLTTLLAIHVGFTAVVVVALMLYGVAAAARP
ncbi:MAG TPA: hypothetical protein VLJ62_25590 [Burkholderiaceae bacterium]|nr:hypothetical protein [Burkholderiaceae bacterium]